MVIGSVVSSEFNVYMVMSCLISVWFMFRLIFIGDSRLVGSVLVRIVIKFV